MRRENMVDYSVSMINDGTKQIESHTVQLVKSEKSQSNLAQCSRLQILRRIWALTTSDASRESEKIGEKNR